jgi:SAM-dependent methyltransferase
MTINGDGQFSPYADHQLRVNDRFHERAHRSEQVYQRGDLFSVIHQHRQARALDWIDGLALPAGSQVLEVGPGAGFMTVELARRGFVVKAADSTPRMVEIASRRAAEAGVADRVRLLVADAHHLAFADEAFILVVALGVVPWLRSASLAVAEMARWPTTAFPGYGPAEASTWCWPARRSGPVTPSPRGIFQRARGSGHGHRAGGTPCTFAVCR